MVGAVVGAVAAGLLLAPGAFVFTAAADDDPVPTPAPDPVLTPTPGIPPLPQQSQHNVTYRARVDGLARGALVTYRINDTQVNSADPTMLPGRTFEATGVLTDPKEAGMRISIQWPYSANLHCEILVDDQMVVQADQFISPRLTPARDDPDYGAMTCGAPLSNAVGAPAPAVPPPAEVPPPVPPPAEVAVAVN